jgi:hypothetical protein
MDQIRRRAARAGRARAVWLAAVLAAVAAALATGVTALAQEPPVPTNDTPPQVAGTLREGMQLTATQGSWQNDPTSFGYQWERCTVPGSDASCTIEIAGATGPLYTLTQADVGNGVRVRVVASNAGGASAPAYSLPTGEIEAATPPQNNVPPAIVGASPPEAGEQVTVDPGSWGGMPAPTLTYQWLTCTGPDLPGCTPIANATTDAYTPVAADIGHRLRVLVTAENVEGTVGVHTEPTEPVVASTRPVNTVLPAIAGTLSVGQTLTASTGTWTTIAPPLGYAYQWQQCDAAGGSCADIPGAVQQTYVLQESDGGHTIRVVVTAEDQAHKTRAATSNPTGAIGSGPVNTSLPTITGTASVGQLLTAAVGSWENQTTLTFTYRWRRCNAQGQACQDIPGATQQTYQLTSSDIGSRIVVVVTARDAANATHDASSAATPAVTGIPAGQPIAVSQVSLPERLIVSSYEFAPSVLRSRAPFTARFRVTDTQGHPVSGADVYLVAVPYGRVAPAGTVRTDSSGWATVTLRPTDKFPLRKGYLITVFARATKPGDDLLAGVSARRLVSVRIDPR